MAGDQAVALAPTLVLPRAAEPVEGETLLAEFQRRKAAFLAAHFGRADEVLASASAGGAAMAPSAPSDNPADWKCHVCNAPLRLLRVRVRLALPFV